MTLDVTIGKLVKIEDGHHVEACPEADQEVCDRDYTIYPSESIRSGSTGFWDFFMKTSLKKLYYSWRKHPNTNDQDLVKLKPHLKKILALRASGFEDGGNKDRLKWLKHWCKVAVDLYGDNAYMEFR